jgi:hypothetical protein
MAFTGAARFLARKTQNQGHAIVVAFERRQVAAQLEQLAQLLEGHRLVVRLGSQGFHVLFEQLKPRRGSRQIVLDFSQQRVRSCAWV